MHGTPEHQQSTLFASLTRLSLSMALLSRRVQVTKKDVTGSHHISCTLPHRIQFVLRRFRSTLITASLLLSFPAGTKMLQFPACPILTDEFRNLWFKGCMRLARAFRSLPRPSSALKPSHPLDGLLKNQNQLCSLSQ
jgi:hypothetical protein